MAIVEQLLLGLLLVASFMVSWTILGAVDPRTRKRRVRMDPPPSNVDC